MKTHARAAAPPAAIKNCLFREGFFTNSPRGHYARAQPGKISAQRGKIPPPRKPHEINAMHRQRCFTALRKRR
jgi:hypothetical protein